MQCNEGPFLEVTLHEGMNNDILGESSHMMNPTLKSPW